MEDPPLKTTEKHLNTLVRKGMEMHARQPKKVTSMYSHEEASPLLHPQGVENIFYNSEERHCSRGECHDFMKRGEILSFVSKIPMHPGQRNRAGIPPAKKIVVVLGPCKTRETEQRQELQEKRHAFVTLTEPVGKCHLIRLNQKLTEKSLKKGARYREAQKKG